MNAKSERIEQLIQIINRNLLLIYNGQVEGVTPIDPGAFLATDKSLKGAAAQKVEMSVFDSDKFGYEMVNFFRSHVKNSKSTIAAIWERNFVKGVETLMTECAVVRDSLERECFVSRVYVWFTDKLVERRNLPGQDEVQYDEIELLKSTMSAMGAFHSVQALDNLSEQKAKADSETLQKELCDPEVKGDENETMSQLGLEGPGIDQLKLPAIAPKGKQNEEGPPSENKPGIDEEGYQPETEAEKIMHELWLARRRQEAFEWKAKQNLNMIMDRRDLHRSRLESEALRREETSSYLAEPHNSEDSIALENSLFSENSRFVPAMRRPLSGKRHFANIISDIELDEDIQSTKQSIETTGHLETTSLQEVNRSIQVNTVNIVKEGAQDKAKVNNISRQVVQKNAKKPYVPMRFTTTAPESFKAGTSSKNRRESFNSDADTESCQSGSVSTMVKSDIQHAQVDNKGLSQKTKGITKRKSMSNTILKTLGTNDSELQVHYEYTLTRKGPISAQHRDWLHMQEAGRVERNLAYNRKLRSVFGNDVVAPPKKNVGNIKKNAPPPSETDDESTLASTPPKYATAKDFMDKHFPVFDGPHQNDAHGGLRKQQLNECEEVMESFEDNGCGPSNLIITREALEKGLVIPQDRPKTICLEGLKDSVEGLMINPLPQELWRKAVINSSSGSGGGGGKVLKKQKSSKKLKKK